MIIIQQPANSTSSHIFRVDGAPQNKLIVPSQVRPIFSECIGHGFEYVAYSYLS